MELLNKSEKWFFSEEGARNFSSLSSLDNRIAFIYSYLKNVLPDCLDEKKIVFKMAFFIADNYKTLQELFSEYPDIISIRNNPFLNYLSQLDYCPSNEALYVVFSAILSNKVDVNDKNEWIHNKNLLTSDEFSSTLGEMGIAYLPTSELEMADPALYELDEKIGLLQLQLAWIFLQ